MNRVPLKLSLLIVLLSAFLNPVWAESENDFVWLIKPKYKFGKVFSEGLWLVKKDDKFGYVDSMDRVIIDFQFKEAWVFENNRANVQDMKGKWGIIDRQGQFIRNPTDDEPVRFCEGMGAIQSGDLWGFINESGVIQVHPLYDEIDAFVKGLALVRKNNLWHYIDSKGNIQLSLPAYVNQAGYFSEGMAEIRSGDVWGYINRSGDVQIEPQYSASTQFHNGTAGARSDGLWGFIDPHGLWKISPQYSRLSFFKEGYALMQSGDLWGIINYDNEIIVEPAYQEFKFFSSDYKDTWDTFMRVKHDEKVGFLNGNLKWIVKPEKYRYPSLTSGWGMFWGGIAFVEEDGKDNAVAIDMQGNILFQLPPWVSIFQFGYAKNLYTLWHSGKMFLINNKGEIVLPAIFDTVLPSKEGPVVVSEKIEEEAFGLILLRER